MGNEKKSQGKKVIKITKRKATIVKPIFFATCADFVKGQSNPPLSPDGIKTAISIAHHIPQNSPRIISGIGARHLIMLDCLLPNQGGRKGYVYFDPFFGTSEIYHKNPDNPSAPEKVILAGGDRILKANYTPLARTPAMLKSILSKLPANTVICTDASILTLLNIGNPRDGKVYRIDMQKNKMISSLFFPR